MKPFSLLTLKLVLALVLTGCAADALVPAQPLEQSPVRAVEAAVPSERPLTVASEIGLTELLEPS